MESLFVFWRSITLKPFPELLQVNLERFTLPKDVEGGFPVLSTKAASVFFCPLNVVFVAILLAATTSESEKLDLCSPRQIRSLGVWSYPAVTWGIISVT